VQRRYGVESTTTITLLDPAAFFAAAAEPAAKAADGEAAPDVEAGEGWPLSASTLLCATGHETCCSGIVFQPEQLTVKQPQMWRQVREKQGWHCATCHAFGAASVLVLGLLSVAV
jgi:hypothetical protein